MATSSTESDNAKDSRKKRRLITFLSTLGFFLSLIATTFYLDDYAESGQIRLPESLTRAERKAQQKSRIQQANATQFRLDGSISSRWQADQVIREGADSAVTLRNLQYLREDMGQGSWLALAKNGQLSASGRILELSNAVELYNPERQITIQTESLTIDMDTETVDTDDAVTIQHSGGLTNAVGLEARLQEEVIHLKSEVRGQYRKTEENRAG
jgi:LPS export ABC transporter protein LptC